MELKRILKVYIETCILNSNLQQHHLNEYSALKAIETYPEVELIVSNVVLRELINTQKEQQRQKLREEFEFVHKVEKDERVYGSNIQSDGFGYGGHITYPLVSDVQDEKMCAELLAKGLSLRDAQHLTQAICNFCDIFLTVDENTIIKPYGEWITSRFKIRVMKPSQLLDELRKKKP